MNYLTLIVNLCIAHKEWMYAIIIIFESETSLYYGFGVKMKWVLIGEQKKTKLIVCLF
jgi:hypothetical protein